MKKGESMRKIAVAVIIFVIILSGCATTNTGTQYAEDAKFIPPTDMVSGTQNKEAMKAYNKGSQLMYAGKYNEAEPYLKKAVNLDPDFVDALDHLGIVYRRQNRYEEAEEVYLRSISLNETNIVPVMNLAVVYRNMNRLEDAFEMYIKLTKIDPDNPEGYYGIGELFQMVEGYESSILFFDASIELYQQLGSDLVYDAYYYQGLNYYYLDEYDYALEYLELAREYHKGNKQLQELIDNIKSR